MATVKKKTNISFVNSIGILVAVLLFGYSISLTSLSTMKGVASSMLAAVSVSINAGVAPNPDNTLAEQLQHKAAQLDVQQKHIEDLQKTLATSKDTLGFFSLLASGFLLLLVAINFYFDWRRNHRVDKGGQESLSVDLRASRRG